MAALLSIFERTVIVSGSQSELISLVVAVSVRLVTVPMFSPSNVIVSIPSC